MRQTCICNEAKRGNSKFVLERFQDTRAKILKLSVRDAYTKEMLNYFASLINSSRHSTFAYTFTHNICEVDAINSQPDIEKRNLA
ncbi:hypothetical protein Trydic_g16646 [Trypoxylus dichotomus]